MWQPPNIARSHVPVLLSGVVKHASRACRGGLDGLKIPPLPSILQGDVVLLDRGRLKETSHVAASSHLHLVPALHVDCVDDVPLDDPDVMAHRAKVRCPLSTRIQLALVYVAF